MLSQYTQPGWESKKLAKYFENRYMWLTANEVG
jgi:hypothetical protein